MKDGFYKQLFDASLTGYAFHRIIRDYQDGNLCDYKSSIIKPLSHS